MGDLNKFPVFFECRSLPAEQEKKIEKYFRIHRKSGGGDCGSLIRVNDDVYKIDFKYQKDQQAVLQRSQHSVRLGDGPLVFTVRGSPEPLSSSPKSTSTPSQNFTTPAQSHQHIPASTPPSSGEEYELHFDAHLRHYLEESPKAGRELEEKLSSVACSAQLYPDEGRVLVRKLTQLDAVEGDSQFEDLYYKDVQNLASLSLSEESTIFASYCLHDGLQVLVCQGDITKQDADALVNAANEDLDHCGGVAAALSKAGGPEVQKESSAIVKQTGKIPIGDVVVTTGGNLNCKKLLHAVGPVGGKSGGKEMVLLEKTVKSALNLAEILELKSIAMPCISSGIFGVPVSVCSEAIVTAVKEFGSQGGQSLSRIILIDTREEVVRAMQEACDRFLKVKSFPMDFAAQDTGSGATAGGAGESVHVEVVQGTIESQEVDALVSPMYGHDPLSTRIGNALFTTVGVQLALRFKEEAAEEMLPGDTVMVEDLPALPSKAVIFLNLFPWGNDPNGTAVEVLRLAIKETLTSCENRGFHSVAFPVLGSGIALRFPESVVAQVLKEEIDAFKLNRASKTPFLVRIVIHPDDQESIMAFKCFQEISTCSEDVHQSDQVSTKRIVLLGKTGTGKSHLANTILGEELFEPNDSPNSGTKQCIAETRSVNGRSITLIDTPGFFDVERKEDEVKSGIMKCITECAPGPHAFLILLKVDKFTEQEKDVIAKIRQSFTEDALKFAVVVFTHGAQLPEGKTIKEFVSQNRDLSHLVNECGGRCHVFDNKYWNNNQPDEYRSNKFQVAELLNTIEKMVMENNGDCYTNKMLQAVEEEMQHEEMRIRLLSKEMSDQEIREQAKVSVFHNFQTRLASTATGVLLGAMLGVPVMIMSVVTAMITMPTAAGVAKFAMRAAGGAPVVTTGLSIGAGVGAVAGAVVGGCIGYHVADQADSPGEAAKSTVKAFCDIGKQTLQQIQQIVKNNKKLGKCATSHT